MYYDKRIRYIDYLENGEKRCNCGYVKMTVAGGSLLMEMQIKGLYETDDVASEIILEGAGTECRIGTVVIRQGRGSFCGEFRDPAHEGEEMILDGGMTYGQLMRIGVQLSPRRNLYCIWREAKQTKAATAEVQPESVAGAAGPEVQPESAGRTAGLEKVSESAARAIMPEKQPESATRAAGLEELPESATRAVMPEKQPESVARAAGLEKVSESAARAIMPEKQPESAVRIAEPEEYPESAGRTAGLKKVSESAARAIMPEKQPESVAEAAGLEELPESATRAVMPEKQPESTARAAGLEEVPERATGAVMPEEQPESVVKEKPEVNITTGMQEEDAGPQEELHTAETQRQSIPEPVTAVLCEDKWQQLQMIYPHIYPFRDERGYLSLRPEDFVILSSNAYRLVRNSFLLHGYYNYGHLILTSVSYKGADQYYIGVPGNFYEKEKQVAVMYGFSRFECKREPAEEGDFGYYMIQVVL